MGFGHAVYKTEDPRSNLLKAIALQLGGERAAFAVDVEREIVDALAELKPGRQLYANVEFYAGVVMERCGIPAELDPEQVLLSRIATVLFPVAFPQLVRLVTGRDIGDPAFAEARAEHIRRTYG